MSPNKSLPLFKLDDDLDTVIYGGIYTILSALTYPLYFIVMKAIHMENRSNSSMSYILMNIINFYQLGEAVCHCFSGPVLMFPIIRAKFDFAVNVVGSTLNSFWCCDFPVVTLLAFCRILIFTNRIGLKSFPILVKLILLAIAGWTLFLAIGGFYTQYFIFVTPGWDYNYTLPSIPFWEYQEMFISFTCIPLSYIAYILMAYLIFAKKNLSRSVQSRKNEISILVQSTFVTIYVTVLVLLWHISLFPPLMALIDMENRRNLAIMNSCYILHCYVNPIATLFCNK
ncbi:Protein CBG27380 [Caenorhabditis briggsae]|uniref:Protein CBG27380 n=1 Tax=Caenorhabditis briggsae TaxID=6238 RepID=B6IGI0_CAEBR|nr:Protein CBG27380 [Caenorhabditis briggsae]CAR99010.1 Protein CBG27380 [Caenorhabditis briggsae]